MNNLSSTISRSYTSNLVVTSDQLLGSPKSSTGVIVGATIGSITFVAISCILLLLLRNRRRRQAQALALATKIDGGSSDGSGQLEKNNVDDSYSPKSSPLSSGSGHFLYPTAYSPSIPADLVLTPSPSMSTNTRTQHRPPHIIIPQRPPFAQSPSSSYTRSHHRRSLSPTCEEMAISSTSAGGTTSWSSPPNSPSRSQRRSSLITVGDMTSRRGSAATMGDEEPLADPSEFRFRL